MSETEVLLSPEGACLLMKLCEALWEACQRKSWLTGQASLVDANVTKLRSSNPGLPELAETAVPQCPQLWLDAVHTAAEAAVMLGTRDHRGQFIIPPPNAGTVLDDAEAPVGRTFPILAPAPQLPEDY
ncbi:hypothetical protein E5288_WYG003300 [Bos mutus]|uniref:Uncharacterized protein n=1 Tax=Bos mutus TaxID=72004 RepID=A0A6B0SBM3_9CETA|nr:hypothetical protein [Bos mutus]